MNNLLFKIVNTTLISTKLHTLFFFFNRNSSKKTEIHSICKFVTIHEKIKSDERTQT